MAGETKLRGQTLDRIGQRLIAISDRYLLKKYVLGATVAILIYLAITPFIFIIWTSFWDGPPGSLDGSFTLQHLIAAYTNPELFVLFAHSLVVAGGSLFLGMLFGLTYAWMFARTDLPGKGWMETVILSPYVIPGFVYAFLFIFLFGPDIGLLNSYLIEWFGLSEPVFNIFTEIGIVFAVGIDTVATVYLLVVPALRNLDPSMEEVARVHGASFPATLREVSFPVVKPAIASAALIVFLNGLGVFSTIAIIGVQIRYYTLSTKVWAATSTILPPNYGYASVLSITLLVITAFLIWWYRRVTARKEDFMTITGSGYQPRQWSLGRFRLPIYLFMAIMTLTLWFLPLLMLVVVAVHPFWSGEIQIARLTLENFSVFTSNPIIGRAFTNSFLIGIAGGIVGVILISLFAYYTERTDYRFRGPADFLVLTPLAAPGIVFGASVLFTYLWVGNITGIELIPGLTVIVIALLGRYLPTASRMATGSIVQIHQELEGSARVFGASWLTMMREIFFPLYKGTMGVIFFYLFLQMFRALSIPLLLYGTGSETISVVIFETWTQRAALEEIAVLCLVFIAIMAVLLVVIRLLGYSFYEVA